jgi:hypothetical protein
MLNFEPPGLLSKLKDGNSFPLEGYLPDSSEFSLIIEISRIIIILRTLRIRRDIVIAI